MHRVLHKSWRQLQLLCITASPVQQFHHTALQPLCAFAASKSHTLGFRTLKPVCQACRC